MQLGHTCFPAGNKKAAVAASNSIFFIIILIELTVKTVNTHPD
jgi:hypothetical protein